MEFFAPIVLKSAGIVSLFLMTYWLFLRKETFFEANRAFLIFGILAAICLPFVTFTKEVAIAMAEWHEAEVVTNEASFTEASQTTAIDGLQIFMYVYIIVVALLVIKTLLQFASLYLTVYKGTKKRSNGINFISVEDQIPPFSVFNNVVYNPRLHNEVALQQILDHETVHCKQRHSIDVILAELLLIIQWFNPLAWLYKRYLQENLEYIADKGALLQNHSKKEYQYTMLRVSQQPAYASITTNFFHKKRIHQIRSVDAFCCRKLLFQFG